MTSMFKKSTLFFVFLHLKFIISSADDFVFEGFDKTNLSFDGIASVASNGLLELTNTTPYSKGHALYPTPLNFKSANGKTLAFSTTFVFAILSEISDVGGPGIAFLVSRTNNFSTAQSGKYLGLLNKNNSGNSTNHLFAVELDTMYSSDFEDIDGNHVGVDINSLKSNKSHTAGYYEDGTGLFKNLSLVSGQPMQVWIDFDSKEMQLNVTLSPVQMPKPNRPLLSLTIDLSSLMLNSMYVGFSSSTGPVHTSHCILGWSFKMNGVAEALDYAKLPSLPHNETEGNSGLSAILLPIASCSLILLIVAVTVLIVRRRKKYAEILEDWELKYGPHRFSYKQLFQATKGFKEKGLLGAGGFGRVYKGVLPTSKMEVAVKKVSHESRQGMKEFVAEIVSIGQLRHRNLVQLLGYCRRKGELILVYDFMPNGSLDKFLYDKTKPALNWAQRFQIIKGVASGLLYLHEEWEQAVVHRDIKASNVLLDSEFNARLGDFGLARLYDHGTDPQTTHVVGTMGYLAPELARTGRATVATDVFAFGAFLLEVACGRRPVEPHAQREELVLMDLVLGSWQRGLVLETRDQRLGEEYCANEVKLVLKLGLLCSHPLPAARPSMRQVMQFLERDAALPELSTSYLSFSTLSSFQNEGFDAYVKSLSSSVASLSEILGGR